MNFIQSIMGKYQLRISKHLSNINAITGTENPNALFMLISDVYSKDDWSSLYEAIDDLFNGNDGYGFGSGAIYCFWDTRTKEILYIGKAIDIANRFKQHNSKPSDSSKQGTKYLNIQEFLNINGNIGYSLFVQSKIEQTKHSKNSDSEFINRDRQEIENFLLFVESSLLNVFKQKNGHIPKWNKSEGSDTGKNIISENYGSILDIITNENHGSLFKSASSIRELSNNSNIEYYENHLLGGLRIILGGFGLYDISADECIDVIVEGLSQEILTEKGFLQYLRKYYGYQN